MLEVDSIWVARYIVPFGFVVLPLGRWYSDEATKRELEVNEFGSTSKERMRVYRLERFDLVWFRCNVSLFREPSSTSVVVSVFWAAFMVDLFPDVFCICRDLSISIWLMLSISVAICVCTHPLTDWTILWPYFAVLLSIGQLLPTVLGAFWQHQLSFVGALVFSFVCDWLLLGEGVHPLWVSVWRKLHLSVIFNDLSACRMSYPT